MKIAIYNLKGQSATEMDLNANIFAVVSDPAVVSQAARVQKANARHAIAHTKTRGEVSGGGRKPWKQKGTGNARAGSSRSPLWTGGGVTFGPRKTRNFALRLPQKMRGLAIKTLLSDKAKTQKLIVLKDLMLEKISTKGLGEILQKLPIEEGKILVILAKPEMNFELSAANLPYIQTIKTNNLNVVDLLKSDYILTTEEAIKQINEMWAK